MPPSPVSPTLFLVGVGEEFVNTSAELPRAVARSGISPIEVLLDSEDAMFSRDRLAVNMHQMFQNQDNRRFAYGLVVTETVFTVYMFDHSGAVASQPCNYHQNPDQFCAVVSGLASDKAESIGFDTNIFSQGHYGRIRTFESGSNDRSTAVQYTIEESLFQFSSLVGRGTICWLCSRPDHFNSTFVVKDAWISPSELGGREFEGSLLHHAKSQGVRLGISQVQHFEQVRSGKDASNLDTVLHNRQVEWSSPEGKKIDRVHTRIVMETHGKTLDKFTSRREFLLAFQDAVLGMKCGHSRVNFLTNLLTAHRNLHQVARILHRDISIRNILINPEGVEGDRGILIDFDHAIRLEEASRYSTMSKIVFPFFLLHEPGLTSRILNRGRGVTCREMYWTLKDRTHIWTI